MNKRQRKAYHRLKYLWETEKIKESPKAGMLIHIRLSLQALRMKQGKPWKNMRRISESYRPELFNIEEKAWDLFIIEDKKRLTNLSHYETLKE